MGASLTLMKNILTVRTFITLSWAVGAIALMTSFLSLSHGLKPYFGTQAPLMAALVDSLALSFTGWAALTTSGTGRPTLPVRVAGHGCVAASVVTNALGAYHAPAPGGTEYGALSATLHTLPPLLLALVAELSAWHHLALSAHERAREDALRAARVQVARLAAGRRVPSRAAVRALTQAVDLGVFPVDRIAPLVDRDRVPPALRALLAAQDATVSAPVTRPRPRPRPITTMVRTDVDDPDRERQGALPLLALAEESSPDVPGWVTTKLARMGLSQAEWLGLTVRERCEHLARTDQSSSLASAGRITTELHRRRRQSVA
jgi:hypothetical protein